MKTTRKALVWLAAVLLVTALAGCGTKEAEKPTKEFASSDGVVSVMLAEAPTPFPRCPNPICFRFVSSGMALRKIKKIDFRKPPLL